MNDSNQPPESKTIPHHAVITVRGVVNRQQPDGMWHPATVFNDSFTVTIDGKNEQEVVTKLKLHLERMKEACQNEEE